MNENNLLKVVDIRVTKSDSALARDTGSASSLAGLSNTSSDLFVKSSYDYADQNSIHSSNSRLSVNRNRSNNSFTTIGSSFSTSSLIRRCITADDIKISINEEQLNEFRSNILNLFAQKQQVRRFSEYFSIFQSLPHLNLTESKLLFKVDQNGNAYIDLTELREALKLVGVDIPGYKARTLEEDIKKNEKNRDGKLSVEDFEKVFIRFSF